MTEHLITLHPLEIALGRCAKMLVRPWELQPEDLGNGRWRLGHPNSESVSYWDETEQGLRVAATLLAGLCPFGKPGDVLVVEEEGFESGGPQGWVTTTEACRLTVTGVEARRLYAIDQMMVLSETMLWWNRIHPEYRYESNPWVWVAGIDTSSAV